ncbi:hypothetical protein F4776DRAFT_451262 [Hypoxylon sp. NC0597]|nr:hypothetical protein F4776DRAFT_451262 [Hypoxylon sp. NC0597]
MIREREECSQGRPQTRTFREREQTYGRKLDLPYVQHMLLRQQWGEARCMKQLASKNMRGGHGERIDLTNMLPRAMGHTHHVWASYFPRNLKEMTHAEPHDLSWRCRGEAWLKLIAVISSSWRNPCSVYCGTVCINGIYGTVCIDPGSVSTCICGSS